MANEQNLKPFTGADDPRRHNGRPKGLKNWSTIVQQILEDEKLFNAILKGKNKPAWLSSLPNKNAGNAIVVAMVARAMTGDKQAADWLRKTGYGDKLDITSGGDKVVPATIIDLGNLNAVEDQHETADIS